MLLLDPEILKTKSASSNGTRIAATEEEAAPAITTNHTMDDDISDISNVSSHLSSSTTGSSTAGAETPSSTSTAAASALSDLPGSTTTSTTQKALDKMNFESGLAGAFALDILQHLVKKEKVCENLHARYEQGSSLREKIQDARRLTGGALFKIRHIALDKEVLALRESKEQEKTDERDQIIKNAVDEYKKRKGEYEIVQNSPKTADNYVGSDFKAIIHYKKRKGDPAVPSNVPQLRARYEETKDRVNLTLEAYLADRGYEGEDVDRVLCLLASELVAVENNGVITV